MQNETTSTFSQRTLNASDLNGKTDGIQEQQHLLNRLEEEREFRDRVLATLTHDLRSTLMAARLGAELLTRKERSFSSQKKITRIIVNSVDQVDVIIRNLLDVSRLRDSEVYPVKDEPCSQ